MELVLGVHGLRGYLGSRPELPWCGYCFVVFLFGWGWDCSLREMASRTPGIQTVGYFFDEGTQALGD